MEHDIPQWSFNNAFSEEDLRAFDNRVKKLLDKNPTYTAELKIDGLKVVLTYEKGELVLGATRGDGKIGETRGSCGGSIVVGGSVGIGIKSPGIGVGPSSGSVVSASTFPIIGIEPAEEEFTWYTAVMLNREAITANPKVL